MRTETNERLSAFWDFLMEWEGRSFENDPSDPGGATKYGIDQRSHPNVDIRHLTEDQAFGIYADEWSADGCNKLETPFAEVFFDTAVNCGLHRAMGFAAAAGCVAERLIGAREEYYRDLAWRHPLMKKYLRGWLNRTEALRQRFKLAPF